MNIGAYTFQEFKQLAENFHGYAAPGLLIGGYMVEMAKARIPEGTLFEAVVETRKCLPDAVQLLTLCSAGNNWMKIHNLGRYAVSLFDKHTGEGVRVSIDAAKLDAWPEIKGWFFKLKAKREQDVERLLREIESAGDSICKAEAVTVKRRFLGHRHMERIACCPVCGEAYPSCDGPVCRGCQGEAPYVAARRELPATAVPPVRVVPVEEAVGRVAAHDMTRIEPGQFKGPEFQAGQRITVGDICRLQAMGRFHVAVTEDGPRHADLIHENEVAELFARRMAGPGVSYALPPHEGKIDFTAEHDGLFCVDVERLRRFNLVPDVMAASRQDATVVSKGGRLAGTRAIPLHLKRDLLGRALDVLGEEPLFTVLPMRAARVGILVTGTEVFKGIIEDKFVPVITGKVGALGCSVVRSAIVPDDKAMMRAAVEDIRAAGADLLVTTGGLSVDPDDVTRQALLECGLTDVVHGVPVLPGTMSLVGNMPHPEGSMQVVGVPACALYFKTTFLDMILPRLLAGRGFTRAEAASLGEGGYCMACRTCTWPKCWFGK
ncbi:MAG: FmdE family protein [Desulfovibrionaceae bacterium]|nr:FmdE family protein [Desulfovibrionaceae bacterium]